MNLPLTLSVIAILSFIASYLETKYSLKVLQKMGILDKPNQRSSHKTPTPRGGGIAIIDITLISFLIISIFITKDIKTFWPFLLAMFALGSISFIDDIKGLKVNTRLLAQLIAVTIGVFLLTKDALLFQGLLPPLIDRLIIAFLWLWFLNLYNFMDGIDGITSTETICITFGLCIIALSSNLSLDIAYYSIAVCAVAAGFLIWNWPPAKLFMGDVGSITLGYIIGWLLLKTAIAGYWYISLILPLYYLADSGITITRRLLKGQKIWQAHKEHYYQQAVQKGLTHKEVIKIILYTNVPLIILATTAAINPEYTYHCLAFAFLIITLLISYLGKK